VIFVILIMSVTHVMKVIIGGPVKVYANNTLNVLNLHMNTGQMILNKYA
jgi:hypothetical protein